MSEFTDLLFKIFTVLKWQDIFKGGKEEKKREYKRIIKIIHPDLHKNDPNTVDAMKILNSFYKQSLSPNLFVINQRKRVYEVKELMWENGCTDIYVGTKGVEKVFIEISKDMIFNNLIENGSKNLKTIKTEGEEEEIKLFKSYLPGLGSSFKLPKEGRAVNIYGFRDRLFSLQDIINKYGLLDGRTVAWIYNRCLEILGFIHKKGFVFGSCLPTNILINPDNHGVVLFGFYNCVKKGEVIKAVDKRYKQLMYPNEIWNKMTVYFSTDLYMLSRSMELLLSTKEELKLFTFFSASTALLQSRRSQDAWEVRDNFKELLRSIYGESKWHNFPIKL